MNDDHDMVPTVLQFCMNNVAAAGRRWAGGRLGGHEDMPAEVPVHTRDPFRHPESQASSHFCDRLGYRRDDITLPHHIMASRKEGVIRGRPIVNLESSKGMNAYSVQRTVGSDRMADIYRITAFHKMP